MRARAIGPITQPKMMIGKELNLVRRKKLTLVNARFLMVLN